jgi:hypothetical protein
MGSALVDNSRPPVKIDAKKLRRIRKMPAVIRAFHAYDLEIGKSTLSGLSRAQSTSLTKASSGLVSTVASLDAATRERVRANPFLLAAYHNKRGLTDDAVDAFVAKAGIERVWDALDRATAPKVALAAE